MKNHNRRKIDPTLTPLRTALQQKYPENSGSAPGEVLSCVCGCVSDLLIIFFFCIHFFVHGYCCLVGQGVVVCMQPTLESQFFRIVLVPHHIIREGSCRYTKGPSDLCAISEGPHYYRCVSELFSFIYIDIYYMYVCIIY